MEVSIEVMKEASMEVAGRFHAILFRGNGSSFGGSTQDFPVEASTTSVEVFTWERLPTPATIEVLLADFCSD